MSRISRGREGIGRLYYRITRLTEYEWNPVTCRHEHKVTGEPLYDFKQPMRLPNKKTEKIEWDWDTLGMPDEKPIFLSPPKAKKRPEWLRFLLEENIASLVEKRRRRKQARAREQENFKP